MLFSFLNRSIKDQIKEFCPREKNFLECAIQALATLKRIINQNPNKTASSASSASSLSSSDNNNNKNQRKPSISETTRAKLKDLVLRRSPHLHGHADESQTHMFRLNQQLLIELESILMQMKSENDFMGFQAKMFGFYGNFSRN